MGNSTCRRRFGENWLYGQAVRAETNFMPARATFGTTFITSGEVVGATSRMLRAGRLGDQQRVSGRNAADVEERKA